MKRTSFGSAAAAALGAAVLFGASTPLAKQLLNDLSPVLPAGLLYRGSGIGLGIVRLVRDRGWRTPTMTTTSTTLVCASKHTPHTLSAISVRESTRP